LKASSASAGGSRRTTTLVRVSCAIMTRPVITMLVAPRRARIWPHMLPPGSVLRALRLCAAGKTQMNG
jgi:hypothetical protein